MWTCLALFSHLLQLYVWTWTVIRSTVGWICESGFPLIYFCIANYSISKWFLCFSENTVNRWYQQRWSLTSDTVTVTLTSCTSNPPVKESPAALITALKMQWQLHLPPCVLGHPPLMTSASNKHPYGPIPATNPHPYHISAHQPHQNNSNHRMTSSTSSVQLHV